jgi:hypothetical protein
MVGPETAATSLLAVGPRGSARGRAGSSSAGAVTPRRPRPGPPQHRAPVVAPASAPPGQRARRRGGRLLLAILVLLTIAVAIVVVVVATAPAPTKVVLRNVVYSDVQQASSALKQLVSENTK